MALTDVCIKQMKERKSRQDVGVTHASKTHIIVTGERGEEGDAQRVEGSPGFCV